MPTVDPLAAVLAEAERQRRRERAASASTGTVAAAASGDATVGMTPGSAPGNVVVLDANGKIPENLLYPLSASQLARSHDHQQQIASTTWTIAHHLDGFPPVVLTTPLGQKAEAEVHYPDRDHVVLKFGSPKTGYAHLSL